MVADYLSNLGCDGLNLEHLKLPDLSTLYSEYQVLIIQDKKHIPKYEN